MLRGHRLADMIAAMATDICAVVMTGLGGARQVGFTLNHQQLSGQNHLRTIPVNMELSLICVSLYFDIIDILLVGAYSFGKCIRLLCFSIFYFPFFSFAF